MGVERDFGADVPVVNPELHHRGWVHRWVTLLVHFSPVVLARQRMDGYSCGVVLAGSPDHQKGHAHALNVHCLTPVALLRGLEKGDGQLRMTWFLLREHFLRGVFPAGKRRLT